MFVFTIIALISRMLLTLPKQLALFKLDEAARRTLNVIDWIYISKTMFNHSVNSFVGLNTSFRTTKE